MLATSSAEQGMQYCEDNLYQYIHFGCCIDGWGPPPRTGMEVRVCDIRRTLLMWSMLGGWEIGNVVSII
jgi:hypothetical protein